VSGHAFFADGLVSPKLLRTGAALHERLANVHRSLGLDRVGTVDRPLGHATPTRAPEHARIGYDEPATDAGSAARDMRRTRPIPGQPGGGTDTIELPRIVAEPDEAALEGSGPQRTARGGPDGDRDRPPDRPDPSDAAAEVWALVERAQSGDAEAFGEIYDRYVDTVFRFVYFRVGNRQLAEDLTADTFLRALKRIGSFTWQGRDLGAWLVTIARNLVADHFKSGRYRLEITTSDVLDADREDRGPEGSPEAAVVNHITNVALLAAVKQLNPEQQECIILRFLQGFSVAETAQAMGKNEGAIKALQYRAVRALARLLPDGFHGTME